MYTMTTYPRRRSVAHPMTPFLSDRFFRSFFDMTDMAGSPGFRVDVKEQPDHYSLEAELPGVRLEDVTLTLEDDVLTIAADVNQKKREQKESYLYSERRSGHMERRFSLEGVRQEDVTASYRDGVLTVLLPKEKPQAEKNARRIAIAGASKEEPARLQGE